MPRIRNTNVRFRRMILTTTKQRQFARQPRAQAAILVLHVHVELEGLARPSRGQRRFHPGVVERSMIFGAQLRCPCQCSGPSPDRRQQRLKSRLPSRLDLLQQISASDSCLQRRQSQAASRRCRSSARLRKKRTTFSGLPRNFARRSGRCVAMPVGQVLR